MIKKIKFTKKGSVTLEIEKTKQINHKIHLLFRIIDTGTGISEEGQKRLFQEFSQTDISITRKYGGTGLELIISKKLSKLMSGEIGVNGKMAVDMHNKNKCLSAGMDDYITKPFKSEDMERALRID